MARKFSFGESEPKELKVEVRPGYQTGDTEIMVGDWWVLRLKPNGDVEGWDFGDEDCDYGTVVDLGNLAKQLGRDYDL